MLQVAREQVGIQGRRQLKCKGAYGECHYPYMV